MVQKYKYYKAQFKMLPKQLTQNDLGRYLIRIYNISEDVAKSHPYPREVNHRDSPHWRCAFGYDASQHKIPTKILGYMYRASKGCSYYESKNDDITPYHWLRVLTLYVGSVHYKTSRRPVSRTYINNQLIHLPCIKKYERLYLNTVTPFQNGHSGPTIDCNPVHFATSITQSVPTQEK